MRYNEERFMRAFPFIATICAGVFFLLSTLVFVVNVGLENWGTTGAGVSSPRELPIYSVQTEEKKIAISFDCAWGVDYTDQLLDCM